MAIARVFGFIKWICPPVRSGSWVLAVIVAEIALLAVRVQPYWQARRIPWHGQLIMAAMSGAYVLSLAWVVYWSFTIIMCLGKGRSSVQAIACAVFAVFSAIACALYLGSWIFFARTQMFLDFESLEFGFRNTPMMSNYFWQVEKFEIFLIAIGVISTAAVAAFLWRRVFYRTSPAASLSLITRSIGGLAVLAFAYNVSLVAVAAYGDPQEGVKQTKHWWLDPLPGRDFELKHRVSPLATLVLASLLHSDLPITGTLKKNELGMLRSEATQSSKTVTLGTKRRRSVILIAMESLRADVIGLRHQGREIMPTLNGLAGSGLWFRRAYAQSSHSNYADPALLSSLYPLRTTHHHYYSRSDPWPKALIYDVLKPHGYDTALFSSQNESWGYMDQFLESQLLDVFFDSRSHVGPTLIADEDVGFSRYANGAGVAGKLDDAVTIDEAISWLKRRNGTPFCLCINLQTSHFPYELPNGNSGPFAPSEYDFPISFVDYPAEKVPVVKNAYFNALFYMDLQLARLVSYLRASESDRDTLVVVAGDNGECFYENGHPTHAGPPFEPSVHVALVMNCPGSMEPKQVEYLTQMVDVVPTIINQLGFPPHPSFQGLDVLATARPPDKVRAAFIHCNAALSQSDAVVTDSGWKLISDNRKNISKLYNLNDDPFERVDLSKRRKDVTSEMRKLLAEWRRRQLLYYQSPNIYGLYFPPKTPEVESELLWRKASTVDAIKD